MAALTKPSVLLTKVMVDYQQGTSDYVYYNIVPKKLSKSSLARVNMYALNYRNI